MIRVRSWARRLALQTLYEVDCTNHPAGAVLASLLQREQPPPAAREFARELVEGVMENRETLDAQIRSHAQEWPFEQMAFIERNLLRIAIYEMMMASDMPNNIAISEAVELAKKFGGESTPRFINGVLGTVAANLPGEKAL